jgi:predicted DCC family thiol-disulfide oxidoreductase YuxK
LRPLSELLIEKVLAERYPDLQREQVSCHAAHIDGDRVMPCGRCEKCRRVVAMLIALDIDPQRCGYTQVHVQHCLNALAARGLQQERPAIEHLAFRLAERGALPSGHIGDVPPAYRAEVESLRFCPERSPLPDVPEPLRRPLYDIVRQYACATLRSEGGQWHPWSPAL